MHVHLRTCMHILPPICMAVPHVRACSWGARLQLSRSGRALPWIGFAIAELICMARSGAYIYLINMTKNQQSFSPITTQGSQSEQFQAIAKPIQARPDNQAPQVRAPAPVRVCPQ